MQREGSSKRPAPAKIGSLRSLVSLGSSKSREFALEAEADRYAIPTSSDLYKVSDWLCTNDRPVCLHCSPLPAQDIGSCALQAQELEVTRHKCKLIVLGALLGDAASYNLSRYAPLLCLSATNTDVNAGQDHCFFPPTWSHHCKSVSCHAGPMMDSSGMYEHIEQSLVWHMAHIEMLLRSLADPPNAIA